MTTMRRTRRFKLHYPTLKIGKQYNREEVMIKISGCHIKQNGDVGEIIEIEFLAYDYQFADMVKAYRDMLLTKLQEARERVKWFADRSGANDD